MVCVQICTAAVSAILKTQKRQHKKVEYDPYEMSGLCRTENIQPGDRPDNDWLLYKMERLPHNEQEWNKCVFVEKTHWGYYTWPR